MKFECRIIYKPKYLPKDFFNYFPQIFLLPILKPEKQTTGQNTLDNITFFHYKALSFYKQYILFRLF